MKIAAEVLVDFKQCSICSSTNKVSKHKDEFFCARHLTQIYTYGKILTRTKYDKNEIIIYENYAEILLYNSKQVEVARAIIDIDDINKVSGFKWNYSSGYVRNVITKKSLQQMILDFTPSKEFIIDHINRNRLDCRKENLRIATYQRNAINKGKQSNNTSGFPGVSYDRYHKKYEAHIKINRKKKFLGYFDNLEDAISCRKSAELKYFGEETNREYDCNTIFKKKGD